MSLVILNEFKGKKVTVDPSMVLMPFRHTEFKIFKQEIQSKLFYKNLLFWLENH